MSTASGSNAGEQERRRVSSAQAGDEPAWRELFDEHYPKLYAFMRRRVGDRETAEDLAAEVFVDAYRGLPRFRWRGTLFSACLFKVARNRLRVHLHGRPPESVDLASWKRPAKNEMLAVEVSDPLSRLPVEYREALELRYLIGLSGAEAAAAMGRSHRAFRMLLHRASQALKSEYGGALQTRSPSNCHPGRDPEPGGREI